MDGMHRFATDARSEATRLPAPGSGNVLLKKRDQAPCIDRLDLFPVRAMTMDGVPNNGCADCSRIVDEQ
jgi:hypothetical protein